MFRSLLNHAKATACGPMMSRSVGLMLFVLVVSISFFLPPCQALQKDSKKLDLYELSLGELMTIPVKASFRRRIHGIDFSLIGPMPSNNDKDALMPILYAFTHPKKNLRISSGKHQAAIEVFVDGYSIGTPAFADVKIQRLLLNWTVARIKVFSGISALLVGGGSSELVINIETRPTMRTLRAASSRTLALSNAIARGGSNFPLRRSPLGLPRKEDKTI